MDQGKENHCHQSSEQIEHAPASVPKVIIRSTAAAPAGSEAAGNTPLLLNEWILEIFSGESCILSRCFLDKQYFYARCSEGDQEKSMLAFFWYLDYLDAQQAMEKACDAFSFDQPSTIKLFRLFKKWAERQQAASFPLSSHVDSIRRYLIHRPLLQKAREAAHFPLLGQDASSTGCFLNLYTYPESEGLCIYACCLCADGYTVPCLELTVQVGRMERDCIALRDDSETQEILTAMRSAGIVTDVIRYEARRNRSIPICRYDGAALKQFTHINRSFLNWDDIAVEPISVQKKQEELR